MSAFEFFFSFFGLILGLSVAEVMTGFARILKRRDRISMGYITPLLAAFLLVDLATFWSNTWQGLQDIEISLHLLVVGIIVAGTYFLAASLVFPEDLDEWSSLDGFYDKHKRWVVGGVWLANIVSGFGLYAFVTPPDEFWHNAINPDGLIMVATFSAILGGVALLSDRRVNAALLVAGLAVHLF